MPRRMIPAGAPVSSKTNLMPSASMALRRRQDILGRRPLPGLKQIHGVLSHARSRRKLALRPA